LLQLLRPAAAFMNRLRYAAKFSLIGLMFLLPLCVVMAYFLREVNRTISVTEVERQGLVVNARLARVMGLVIGNSDAIRRTPSMPTPEIDSAIRDVDAAFPKEPRYAQSLSDWRSIERDWHGRGVLPAELSKRVFNVVGRVGIASNLVLDSEPASYYLMDTIVGQTPTVLANLGDGVAANAQFPAGKTPGIGALLTFADKRSRVSMASDTVTVDLNEAWRSDPSTKPALAAPALRLEEAEKRYAVAVNMRISDPTDSTAVNKASLELLSAALEYHAAATRELDRLFQERLQAVTLRRLTVTGLAAFSLVLAFYFFGGFYIGTLDGLRRLFRTAQRIAHGDVNDVTTTTKPDEVGRLAADLESLVRRRTHELIEARNAAQSANIAKSHFLANMSHELRTPLNAVLGFSSLMRTDPSISGPNRETLDIINRSGEHLLSLINDVLDVARIEAGRATATIEPFDLSRLVRDITDMMRGKADEKELTLTCDLSSDCPRFICSDAAKIRQILINLVGNAVRYTERGSVTIKLTSETLEIGRAMLTIDISDTGIGIAREDQARMYEPFVQLSTSASRKGTGLGLAITRQYVDLLDGSIDVHSEVGRGTQVAVRLPVNIADEGDIELEPDEHRIPIGLASVDEVRVLIVEDQPENVILLDRLLARCGLTVQVAVDGRQGVEKFQEWRPHFIWMDRRMPEMDGLEATRRIRELPGGQSVKIVGLSASALVDQKAESIDAGMDDFVGKPYRPGEIFNCMARHLGIEFVYPETSVSCQPLVELTPELMRSVPEGLRARLSSSVINLDSSKVDEVIAVIAATHPQIAATLAVYAGDYAYTAIMNLLTSASGRQPSAT